MPSGGRPVLGAISGVLLGLFVFLLLVVYAGLALNSTVLFVVLLAVGLVIGLALGITGPLGGRRSKPTAPSSGPAEPAP